MEEYGVISDPVTGALAPYLHPATGEPVPGRVLLADQDREAELNTLRADLYRSTVTVNAQPLCPAALEALEMYLTGEQVAGLGALLGPWPTDS